MEKVRFGLIGIGAQGGAYAGFLTGKGGMFGMPAPECPPHCALGALCDIDPEKEALCREKYPEYPFYRDWKEMVDSGNVDAVITTVPHAYGNRNLLLRAWHERSGRKACRSLCKSGS